MTKTDILCYGSANMIFGFGTDKVTCNASLQSTRIVMNETTACNKMDKRSGFK